MRNKIGLSIGFLSLVSFIFGGNGVTRTIYKTNLSFTQVEGSLESFTSTLQQTARTKTFTDQTTPVIQQFVLTGIWGVLNALINRSHFTEAKGYVPTPYPVESVEYEWPTSLNTDRKTGWDSTPDAKHTLSTKIYLPSTRLRTTPMQIVHYIPNDGLAFVAIHKMTLCNSGFNEKGLTIATRLYLKKDILNFDNTRTGVPLGPILCEVLRQARTINDAYQIVNGYPHLQRFEIYITSGTKEVILTNIRWNANQNSINDTPIRLERVVEKLRNQSALQGPDRTVSDFYTLQFWPHKRLLSVQMPNNGAQVSIKLKDMRGSTHSFHSVR